MRNRTVFLATVLALLCLPVLAGAQASGSPFVFTKVDLDLWEKANQADQQLEEKRLVFDDAETNKYLQQVGEKVVPQAALERVTWRFRVLRDPTPNAFSLPNGSVYIHSGLLSALENEAQLAGILGHEATHVINRHAYLEYRSYRKKTAAINIVSGTAGYGGFFGMYGYAASVVLQSVIPSIMTATIYGYNRDLEREADLAGLKAMVAAGYQPSEMAASFRLLRSGHEVQLQKEPGGLYTDHPKLEDRIKYVTQATAGWTAAGAPIVHEAEYSGAMQGVMRHDIPLEILAGRARTAVAIATQLTLLNAGSSEDAYLLGEAFRALGGRTSEPLPDEITEAGKNDTREKMKKMTLQEYDAWLLTTEQGKAAWARNAKSAEAAYQRAQSLDSKNALAVRGLAMLREQEGRNPEALEGYKKYLQLAPQAQDAYRIKRRIESLEKISTAAAPGMANN